MDNKSYFLVTQKAVLTLLRMYKSLTLLSVEFSENRKRPYFIVSGIARTTALKLLLLFLYH